VEKTKSDQALAAFHKCKGNAQTVESLGIRQPNIKARWCCRKRKRAESRSKKNKKEKKTECDMSNIQCFQCGEMGHFQSKCPKAKSKMGNTKQPEKLTWSS